MRLGVCLVLGLVCAPAFAGEAVQRTLTFEDRVKAQAAIERVYYSHQVGATKRFDEAVPKEVLEQKVRTYLEQTAALSGFWKTAVTDYMLQRELERMTQGTRMPERLRELYAALGNDAFQIKECLARPALVDRLTRNFYASDRALHARMRNVAEKLRAKVAAGELDLTADHPNRTVSELIVSETGSGRTDPEGSARLPVTLEEFQRRRSDYPTRVGQVSDIRETRDAFAFSVVLNETTTALRTARYVVPKTSWEVWWETAGRTVQATAVTAVASPLSDLPVVSATRSMLSGAECAADDTWNNGILDDAPDPRYRGTSIWTGQVMIVWGGEGGFTGDLNTGGRYDPATDTWTPTSTVGAPTARQGHTAVWTGSVMVVWGGMSLPAVGGRYDPVTDTWLPTSTVNAPIGRYLHTAVWTGTTMAVWGGESIPYGGDVNTGGLYDPSSDTWTSMSIDGAPAPCESHLAVWTGSLMVVWGCGGGRYDPQADAWSPASTVGGPLYLDVPTVVWTGSEMLVWGGWSGSGPVNTGARYDPLTDHWTEISTENAPTQRAFHSAVWTGTEMLVWGGTDDGRNRLSSGGRYDPQTDSWSELSDDGAPSRRTNPTAIWTGSLMIVWGGDYYGKLNTGGRYDPNTDAWTPTSVSGAPAAGAAPSSVWTGNEAIVWGGYDANVGELDSGGRYDPALDTWTPTSLTGAPTARDSHTAVWTGSEMLVWGGYDDETQYPTTGGRYDPVTDRWLATSTLEAPVGRFSHTAVWTGQRMIVWGGYNGQEGLLNTGGRYDPATDSWTSVATDGAPTFRDLHTAVWTGRWMVIWGGEFGGRTGGRYDPETDLWMPTSEVRAPSARFFHTAVWTGEQMIVWGGRGNGPVNTGGRYNPDTDTWAPTSTLLAPSARIYHTAIWTKNQMVVWGGYGGAYGSYANTGGRYNPWTDRWTSTSTVGAPSGRSFHTAVWTGTSMIVWGGQGYAYFNSGGSYLVDLSADVDRDGYTLCAGDCDDANPAIHPGATEICNGVDDNCDRVTDNGGSALCDDHNTCTDDFCNGASGCSHANNTTICNDGNPCTNGDTCGGGSCAGTPVNGITCNDANACTTGDTCAGGVCTGTPLDCDDHDVCTTDTCDPYYGCFYYYNTEPCSDGNACTVSDRCEFGECRAGSPTVCNDANPCTDDSCDATTGLCGFENDDSNACSDGNLCTQSDACIDGICVSSNPVQCNSGCPQGSTALGDACQKTYDIDASLLDGLFSFCDATLDDRYTTETNLPYGFHWTDRAGSPAAVTRVDVELVAGRSCIGGARDLRLNGAIAGIFDPGYSCQCPPSRRTVAIPALDVSTYVLGGINAISIRNPYFYGEGLSRGWSLGSSFARVTVTYAPTGNACQVGTCAPATGACTFSPLPNGIACNDASVCTGGDTCSGGACRGLPIDCNDRIGCTDDSCDPETGCVHVENPIACYDYNPCTDDSCSPVSGCLHINNSTPCNDLDACTTGDTCGGGTCNAGAPVVCDDHNTCTTDRCDPTDGCIFTDNTNPCDDGNACTVGDTCGPPITSTFPGENFDLVEAPALPPGWTSTVEGTGRAWVTRVSSGDSPPNAAFGMDSGALADTVLESPAIPITSRDATLSFRNRWRFENDTTCYDAAVLEIAIGDGPFRDIIAAGGIFLSGQYNWYVEPNSNNPLGFRSAWCGTSENYPAFVTTTVVLPPGAAGQAIRLRWRVASDQSVGYVGQDVDSIVILDGSNTCNGGSSLECDDGNDCTDDTCHPSVGCVHDTVSCTALDSCHTAGVCNPSTGSCSNPIAPEGTVCNDHDLCTTGETCQAGTCTPAFSGLNEPKPRTVGYYKALCDGPHSGDQLTDGDAGCVASVAQTFAGVSTVADLCEELRPTHPTIDPCDIDEDDLLVVALNICRARVCTAQGIDSRCGGKYTVGQSLAESDDLFRSASRSTATCDLASCLDQEINTGKALEMNSLSVRRDGSAVRLDWNPPYLDDGSGHPREYNVWRRPLPSQAPFAKIGATTDATFVDATAAAGNYQYEVTAVMN